MNTEIYLGIDIGSTTVKLVAVQNGAIVYKKYERHFSKAREKACELLEMAKDILRDAPIHAAITGSAGLGMANASGVDFVQEVFAARKAVGVHVPSADVVIELGGEDAKIIFLTGQLEERMNGSCAGGTGAFIDQMAVLLDVTPEELDTLSQHAERIYTIASRCGVFAKTDIQPLLNEGARKRGRGSVNLSGCCESDVDRIGAGTSDCGRYPVFRRSAVFLSGIAGKISGDSAPQ